MKRLAVASLALAFCALPAAADAATPGDAFTEAIQAGSSFSYSGTFVGATREAGEPACGGPRSIWFKLRFQQNESLSIEAWSKDNAPTIGVFQGSSLESLRQLECVVSEVTITLHGEQDYYIQLSGPDAALDRALATEDYSFSIRRDPLWFVAGPARPLSNDDISDATEIASLPFGDMVDLSDASRSPQDPSDCMISTGRKASTPVVLTPQDFTTAWYEFSADREIDALLRAQAQMDWGYRPAAGIYEFVDGDLQLLACTRHVGEYFEGEWTHVQLSAGHDYFLSLTAHKDDEPATLQLSELPAGDIQISRLEISASTEFSTSHWVDVEVRQVGQGSTLTDLTIETCPAATGKCDTLHFEQRRTYGTGYSVRVGWMSAACTGDVLVRARVTAKSVADLDPSNNEVSRVVTLAGGTPGAGVCAQKGRL